MIPTVDPNRSFGKHECSVVLKSWDYEKEIRVTIDGNCQGVDVIKAAADDVVELVFLKGVVLSKSDGDTLEFKEGEHSEWEIERMVVAVTILSFQKD